MRIMLIVWLSILSSALVAEARTWTDSTGTHHLDAELVSLAGGKVSLQTGAGRIYSIALTRLCPADRQVVLGLDRNLQPADLQGTADASVPQTLTAALQLASPGSSGRPSGGSSPSASDALSRPPSDFQMRQNPAPLTLDPVAPSGQMPSTQEAQQAATPSKDKRIFSGCKSTFQLHGHDGTGAYWIGGKHYLAKLTFSQTEGNYVSFANSGEGGVEGWAFFDVESCGASRVYAWMRGSSGWRLFDHDDRELPD